MNDRGWVWTQAEVDELDRSERAKVSELLADQTAFIAQLTSEQKDNLLTGLHTILFGWPRRAVAEKVQLMMLRDEFEETCFEVLGMID